MICISYEIDSKYFNDSIYLRSRIFFFCKIPKIRSFSLFMFNKNCKDKTACASTLIVRMNVYRNRHVFTHLHAYISRYIYSVYRYIIHYTVATPSSRSMWMSFCWEQQRQHLRSAIVLTAQMHDEKQMNKNNFTMYFFDFVHKKSTHFYFSFSLFYFMN